MCSIFFHHCALDLSVFVCVYFFSVCKLWFTTCNQSWHQLNSFGEEKQSKIKKEKFNLIYKSDCDLIKVKNPSYSRLFPSQLWIVCFFWADSNYSSHSEEAHCLQTIHPIFRNRANFYSNSCHPTSF